MSSTPFAESRAAEAYCTALAQVCSQVALWGTDSAGNLTECSFPGYSRQPLDPSHRVTVTDGEVRVVWPMVAFGPLQTVSGVLPRGWALLDGVGNMVVVHPGKLPAGVRPGMAWRVTPGAKVSVTLPDGGV